MTTPPTTQGHTEGPYTVTNIAPDKPHGIWDVRAIGKNGYPIEICTVYGGSYESAEEAMAVAYMLASAPDMLAVCEEMLRVAPTLHSNQHDQLVLSQPLRNMRTVLARARGEAVK